MFVCDACDKTYTSKRSMLRHAASSHSDVKFSCTLCPCRFTRKDNLCRHLRSVHRNAIEVPPNRPAENGFCGSARDDGPFPNSDGTELPTMNADESNGETSEVNIVKRENILLMREESIKQDDETCDDVTDDVNIFMQDNQVFTMIEGSIKQEDEACNEVTDEVNIFLQDNKIFLMKEDSIKLEDEACDDLTDDVNIFMQDNPVFTMRERSIKQENEACGDVTDEVNICMQDNQVFTKLDISTDGKKAHKTIPIKCSDTLLMSHEMCGISLTCSTTKKKYNDQKLRKGNPVKKIFRGILRDINIKRRTDLTPRKVKIYDALKAAKKSSSVLKHRNISMKKRLLHAEKYMENHKLALMKLNGITCNFIQSQIKTQSKKAAGWRFTLDEKIFALSLFKKSGKAYKLLQKIFSLPSKSSLINILRKIPFQPGINKKIFEHLKCTVQKIKNPLDKYCIILFDEISLSPGLQYVSHYDKIVGFEDLGDGRRKPVYADKALTFMVRGVRKKFKQPVAFMFTNSTIKTPSLVVAIKEVVQAVQAIGLNVVSLICDQASTNVAAVNILKTETNAKYLKQFGKQKQMFGFELGGQEIVPLYDPPHLLKCFRNNLLTKNLKYTDKDGKVRVAKWEHITQLYILNQNECAVGERINPKLTDSHVYADCMKKMKVSHAAQVFSQQVGSIMKVLATWSKNADTILNSSAEDTGQLCLFMDKLFDSVNGSTVTPQMGKNLRCAVTSKSAHWDFWIEAIHTLESMAFICKQNKVVLIKNWIETIKGIRYISRKLLVDGFDLVLLRNFNLDPIENFFGCIRSHGTRSVNPTCASFISSFKTLLISNLTARNSISSNCEKDDFNGLLDSLKSLLLLCEPDVSEINENLPKSYLPKNITLPKDSNYKTLYTSSNLQKNTKSHVAGSIIKKTKPFLNNCKICKYKLRSDNFLNKHNFIKTLEFKQLNLIHPKTRASNLYGILIHLFNIHISDLIEKPNLKKEIILVIKRYINFEPLYCPYHDLLNIFLNNSLRLLIFSFIKDINRILKIGEQKPSNTTNKIKLSAIKYYKTYKNKSKKFIP